MPLLLIFEAGESLVELLFKCKFDIPLDLELKRPLSARDQLLYLVFASFNLTSDFVP
jgi:hypothetical protein